MIINDKLLNNKVTLKVNYSLVMTHHILLV